jgi:IPT/TIG domain
MRLLAIALFALPVFAQHSQFSMTPASGNVIGGTVVTITGDLLPHNYDVYFDFNRALAVTRVDDHTLVAIAPPHVAGVSTIGLRVFGVGVPTGLTFEYTGDSRAAFERFLLPVFTPPIPGAFGSEFRTDFDAINLVAYYGMRIFGLNDGCCGSPYNPRLPAHLGQWGNPEANAAMPALVPNGTPGRFAYVSKEHALGFEANLRAYDTSRSAENFGTEIPVVRGGDFKTEKFALLGVPLDPRFRNTLRIYGYEEGLTVTIQGLGGTRTVTLTGATDTFTPAYAQISDFPTGTGVTDVIIDAGAGTGVWAFITVTNNETQHITTITPR